MNKIRYYTGNTGTNQLPMKTRAKNVFADIVKRQGIRREFIDPAVLKHLFKKGLVKTKKVSFITSSLTIVVPVNMPEIVEDTVIAPYAKRKAALDEAGMPYRGKVKDKEPLKNLKDDAMIFYFEFETTFSAGGSIINPGIYLFNAHYNSINPKYTYNATRIWGITQECKAFYVKQRATNPKKNAVVSDQELVWIKLTAKVK